MKLYKVIRNFKDKDERIYKVNDDYPHADAKKPTAARLKTLSSTENDYGYEFIEKVATPSNKG